MLNICSVNFTTEEKKVRSQFPGILMPQMSLLEQYELKSIPKTAVEASFTAPVMRSYKKLSALQLWFYSW